MVRKCLLEIEQDLNNILLELKQDLDEFFEKNERSETLLQWRDPTIKRLDYLCKEHKEEAKNHCNMLKWTRNSQLKIDIN